MQLHNGLPVAGLRQFCQQLVIQRLYFFTTATAHQCTRHMCHRHRSLLTAHRQMALCFQYVDDLHHAFADVLINNACLAKQVESGFHIRCLSFNNSVPVPHSLPVVDGRAGRVYLQRHAAVVALGNHRLASGPRLRWPVKIADRL